MIQIVQHIQKEKGVYRNLHSKNVPIDIPLLDFGSQLDPKDTAEAWIEETTQSPFKFNSSPLLLFKILKISETEIDLLII